MPGKRSAPAMTRRRIWITSGLMMVWMKRRARTLRAARVCSAVAGLPVQQGGSKVGCRAGGVEHHLGEQLLFAREVLVINDTTEYVVSSTLEKAT